MTSRPVLTFAIHEDGSLERTAPCWFPAITLSADVVAAADGRRIERAGDELTFRCTNGGATYHLSERNPWTGTYHGRLLRSWGC